MGEGAATIQLYHGDCLDILPTLEAASVDCVITDPPYPMIKRDYGMMTEAAWMEMTRALIPEVRRVLKPTGSAVFILQPNSERIGRMRVWLWEFMAWVGREWGVLQDVYWWNTSALPDAFSNQGELMRSSIKPMVWCGEETAYRNQSAILWKETERNAAMRQEARMNLRYSPSGVHHVRNGKMGQVAERRGGVTPFNLLPVANSNSVSSAGAHSHEAGTPYALADWWTRYICPPHGVVFDPFMGSGTMGLAAIRNECGFIGIERMEKYYEVAKTRIEAERDKPRTMRMELT